MLAGAGAAVGEGVGGAFGGLLGSIPRGFQTTFMGSLPEGFKTEDGEFRPLLGTKEEFEQGILNSLGFGRQEQLREFDLEIGGHGPVAPRESDQPQEERTVTPETREFSDLFVPQVGRSPAEVAESLDPLDPRLKGLRALMER